MDNLEINGDNAVVKHCGFKVSFNVQQAWFQAEKALIEAFALVAHGVIDAEKSNEFQTTNKLTLNDVRKAIQSRIIGIEFAITEE